MRAALALGLVGAFSASPVAAQDLPGQALCQELWSKLITVAKPVLTLTGEVTPTSMVGCLFTEVKADLPGQYVPDWHIGSLHLRWGVQDLVDGRAPEQLDLSVSDLRLVVQTGDAQMDYLFAAQARANPIRVDLTLAWDKTARELLLERLVIDFPGDNLVSLTAKVAGVDLSSTGAMQMSATSFAVTEADLIVQSHGLFEWYVLMTLGPLVLPREGDMKAAADALRADLGAMVAELPAPTFPDATRQALLAMIEELPNPAGVFSLSLRSDAGVGPARLMGYAMTGVPTSMEAAAPLFDGVKISIGWEPEDVP
jgi:hypothetical protein